MASLGNGTHSTATLIRAVAVSMGASLIIALAVFYVGYGQNTVTKDQLQNAINTYSPYAQDRVFIRAELDRLTAEMSSLREKGDEDRRTLAALRSDFAALSAEVDTLLRLHVKP